METKKQLTKDEAEFLFSIMPRSWDKEYKENEEFFKTLSEKLFIIFGGDE